jgi:hypothetical protein
VLPVSVDQVWVRLDEANRLTGDRFVGSLSALEAFLSQDLQDPAPDFSGSGRESVYVEHLFACVDVYLVMMKTPWGSYRWIQEPPPEVPSLRHRLVEFLHRPVP